MQTTMNVGIARLHGVHHGIDHRARLLRRGGIVEINERLAIDLLRQDRKLGPDRFDIVWLHGSVHCLNHFTGVMAGTSPAMTH